MRALYYPEYERLDVRTVEKPLAAPGEVIVRVAACGICGSELETFKNRSPRRTPPLIMGHEFCGIIDDAGAGVEGWKKADKIVSNSLVPCTSCVRCKRGDTHLCADRQIFGMHRPGAFAEYVAVPAHCLLSWPDQVEAQDACLAEPLANGVHIVNMTRAMDPGHVVVLGAGPIGLMVLQAYKSLSNATVWVGELNPDRLEAAGQCGADRVVNVADHDIVELVRESTEGEGADIVVDAVGSSVTNKSGLALTRPGGSLVVVGLHEDSCSLPSYQITLPEKRVLGSYAATMDELATALDLFAAGKIHTSSWVDTYNLDDGVHAFNRMLSANGTDIKAVLLA